MRTGSPFCRSAAVIASTAMVTCGCARFPPLEGVSRISLSVNSAALAAPAASISGESDLGAGSAAAAGLEAATGCDFLMFLCAIFTVPGAAIFGAAVKASQKLPEEQALALNAQTADITRQLDLAAGLRSALRAEARRREIEITSRNAGAVVFVTPQYITWDISAGNHVALYLAVSVSVNHTGERHSAVVTYRGDSAQVNGWTTDDGAPIRSALDDVMIGASQKIWEQILGREQAAD